MEEELTCISKSNALQILVNGLTHNLKLHGFIYSKSNTSFKKKTTFGFQEISILADSRWPAYISLNIMYGVRIDKIEDLRSKFIDNRFGNFSKSDLNSWTTVYLVNDFKEARAKFFKPHLFQYHPYELHKGFIIENEADVEMIINDFNNSIINNGFPFFEGHQTAASVVGAKKDNFNNYDTNLASATACIDVLIVLKLARDNEYSKYKELVLDKIKSNMVESKHNDPDFPRIQALNECIVYLDKFE